MSGSPVDLRRGAASADHPADGVTIALDDGRPLAPGDVVDVRMPAGGRFLARTGPSSARGCLTAEIATPGPGGLLRGFLRQVRTGVYVLGFGDEAEIIAAPAPSDPPVAPEAEPGYRPPTTIRTTYVVQQFITKRKRLVPGPQDTAPSESGALKRAEALAARVPGAAALRIEVDDETGELQAATVLGTFGEVPDAFAEGFMGG